MKNILLYISIHIMNEKKNYCTSNYTSSDTNETKSVRLELLKSMMI